MADITLTITIPDTRTDDLVSALRHRYGLQYSLNELRALEESRVLTNWKDDYKKYVRDTADEQDLTTP